MAPNTHNTFFRERFTRRGVARNFLHCLLLAELLAELDPTTLQISKDCYLLVDLPGPTDTAFKGRVLTRLNQLAMRTAFNAQRVEPLALIEKI